MRFLLDQNLPPGLAAALTAAGHDAVHVSSLGLASADDRVILERAADEQRVIVSADTDFGGLLAVEHRTTPSVILIRRERPRRPEPLATLLLNNLQAIEQPLEDGAIVVFEEARIRIRGLPIVPTD